MIAARRASPAAVLMTLLAVTPPPGAAANAAPAAAGGNGTIGMLNGEGGDPSLGAAIYGARCSGCHDHPGGRIPAKAGIAQNTRAFIVSALSDGVMRPMAQGLSPHELASIAAYLSARPGGAAAGTGTQAPRCTTAPPPLDLSTPDQWNGWGNAASQARFQADPGLRAADIPRLKLKWAFAYPNSRGGQATVIGGWLFLNASTGAIYALDAKTGCARWRFDAPAASRGTIIAGPAPGAASGTAIYFTDNTRSAYALDAGSGALLWKTLVDGQQEVQMTGSPALSGSRLFVPISSAEEAIAADPAYRCCKFRGAVAALDAASGRLLWKTYVTPAPAKPFRRNAAGAPLYGPAGGAIWSAPAVDPARHVVYVATGDSYTDLPLPNADAVLALDERTGAIRWSHQFTSGDNYIQGCDGPHPGPNCPVNTGQDFDFGASPILHTLPDGHRLLLAGQKSGWVYALDPGAGGRVVWSRRVSPGGPLGGVEFGMAASGDTLFVPVSDIYVPAPKARPGITAMRIGDGAILWSRAAKRQPCAWTTVFCSPAMSQAITAIPGAVFGGSMDGRFRAFDAATGRAMWRYDTAGAPVTTVAGRQATGGVMDGAGPTVAAGIVYENSGYWDRSGRPGTVLMAFSKDGH